MINRPVSFYLALADAWLLVNEQQPVYQFRIRNQYNGMTTEWNSVARDKVIEVIKMQPETAEFRVLVPSAPEPAANARQLISEIEGLREAIGKLTRQILMYVVLPETAAGCMYTTTPMPK